MDRTAEGILKYLIELLQYYLADLNGSEDDKFLFGQKYAFVECLEIIQEWDQARALGLDYDVEKRFPIF